MGSPRAFDGVASRVNGSGPSLGGSHDDHGPSGLGDGFSRSRGGLDLFNLFESPLHGYSHVVVDVDIMLVIRTALGESSVLDDSNLVAVAGEQAGELKVRYERSARMS